MEQSKLKVMFITEKWCDGNPQRGLTNHYHNLFGTLASLDIAQIGIFHYDEYSYNSGKHADEIIPSLVTQYDPAVVVMSHLGSDPMNPTKKSYEFIHNSGKKIVVIWPDTRDKILDTIKEMSSLVSLNVSWCFETDSLVVPNHMWLATPQDPRLYKCHNKKEFDVTFVGSLDGYTHRKNYLEYAISKRCPVIVSGGQRENALSSEDYASIIGKSKISINFAESAVKGKFQLKGRVTETLACGVFLLEQKNDVTSRVLQSGVHYVEFENEQELVEKINYYLKNDAEREKIAAAGLEFYKNNFTPAVFWNTILKRIGVSND